MTEECHRSDKEVLKLRAMTSITRKDSVRYKTCILIRSILERRQDFLKIKKGGGVGEGGHTVK